MSYQRYLENNSVPIMGKMLNIQTPICSHKQLFKYENYKCIEIKNLNAFIFYQFETKYRNSKRRSLRSTYDR